MERLTERDEFGNASIIGVDNMKLEYDVGCDVYDKLTDAMEKLAEYEDLEERGKLLKLPCAVGNMTYHVSKLFGITDAIVIRIEVDSDGFWVITSSGTHSFDDFGKTVFLIREEAEAALKELKTVEE